MKVTVPDLTMIAARNQGKFDSARIQAIIRGTDRTTKTPAHGVEDMPIWGDVFRSDDRGTNTLRIGNLVSYLQSIQAKYPGAGLRYGTRRIARWQTGIWPHRRAIDAVLKVWC